MRIPHTVIPVMLLFIASLAVHRVGVCSQKEDFEFLDQTFDNSRFTNSGEDLLKNYSIFVLSTVFTFEAQYWFFELLRSKLNHGPELNSYFPAPIELAALMTASFPTWSKEYSHLPGNAVLHGLVKTGGSLQAVICGKLLTRGEVSILASGIIFITAASLAETLTSTVSIKIMREKKVHPDENFVRMYDDSDALLASIVIGWEIGFLVFDVLAIGQIPAIKSVAASVATATLSAAAIDAIYIYTTRLDIRLDEIAGAGAGAVAGAVAIAIAGAIAGAGVVAGAGVGVGAGVVGVGAGAIAVAIAGAIAGAGAGVVAGARAVDEDGDGDGAVFGVGVGVGAVTAVGTGAGAGLLFILLKQSPIPNAHYSRVAATIVVASILALANSVSKYANDGVPIDETFLDISWYYWKLPYELIHKTTDYLWIESNSE